MAQLSEYGDRVVDRVNLIGMWLSVVICVRNFIICYDQYRRTRGKIHLVNIAQVVVFFIYRFMYGLIPLFEIKTCAMYQLLVSLWHLDYLLIYTVMFMRLLILESDKNSLWIKLVGAALISLRFADWPYELSFTDINQTYLQESSSLLTTGSTCWAIWPHGVIILNFIADALANLFLSGMFVRRLYVHIRQSRKAMNHRNCVIEYIARKSLICLALTFVVNLIMNLFKVTMFLGVRSDAFTVYFSIIESTLLVEALRVDHQDIHNRASCQQCKQTCYTDMERHGSNSGKDDLDEPKCYTPHDDDDDDDDPAIRHTNKLRLPDSHHSVMELTPINTISPKSITLVNKKINQLYPPPITTHYSYQHVSAPYLKSSNSVLHTSSAPPFAITKIQPVVRSSGVIEAVPTMSLGSIEFDDKIKWKSTGRSGKQHQH